MRACVHMCVPTWTSLLPPEEHGPEGALQQTPPDALTQLGLLGALSSPAQARARERPSAVRKAQPAVWRRPVRAAPSLVCPASAGCLHLPLGGPWEPTSPPKKSRRIHRRRTEASPLEDPEQPSAGGRRQESSLEVKSHTLVVIPCPGNSGLQLLSKPL